MKRSSLFVILLISASSFFPALNAQTTGAFEGRILDPTEAAVQGVSVLLIESQTDFQREVVSDERGYYRALRLMPGIYEIKVSASGFREEIRQGNR